MHIAYSMTFTNQSYAVFTDMFRYMFATDFSLLHVTLDIVKYLYYRWC